MGHKVNKRMIKDKIVKVTIGGTNGLCKDKF